MISIEELKEKIKTGKAILLPLKRNRQQITGQRIQLLLINGVMTRKEIMEKLGYKGNSLTTLNYMEKRGIIRAVHINGSALLHYVLTEKVES